MGTHKGNRGRVRSKSCRLAGGDLWEGATEQGRRGLAGDPRPVGRFNFASERRFTVCELNSDVRMAASPWICHLKRQGKNTMKEIPLVGVEWI